MLGLGDCGRLSSFSSTSKISDPHDLLNKRAKKNAVMTESDTSNHVIIAQITKDLAVGSDLANRESVTKAHKYFCLSILKYQKPKIPIKVWKPSHCSVGVFRVLNL